MKYFIRILICLIFINVSSQNYFDIVHLSYANTVQNEFKVSNDNTTIEEFALELNFPFVINDRTTVLTGLFSNKNQVKLNPNSTHSNLSVIGLNFGINTIFNDKLSATFMAIPRLASDKIKFSNNNFQLGLLSLFTSKKRDDLKYKFGLYVNSEKYGMLLVPIFGIYYVSPNNKFEANLNLPITADLNYKLRNKLWLGMKFDGLGTTFNLSDQDYSSNSSYVSKQSNEIVSYLRFKLSKSIYLNTKIGYAILRKYDVYDSKDKVSWALGPFYFRDNRTLLNERFKDGAIFKVELFYRIHFD